MPTMANLTVKRADGITDIVYNALSASGGDGSPSIWRQDSGNARPIGMRPTFRVWSKFNGPKTARVIDAAFLMPITYLDANSGLTKVMGKIPMTYNGVFPMDITTSELGECVQAANLVATALFKEVLTTGYAPT